MIPAYHAAFHFVTHNLLSTLFHSWCSHTFAFLFQVVLASVLVFIFQCDAVERFGPKYLVAGYLGWPLGRNRSTGAFSQIRIPEAHGRWAPVRGRGCGSAPVGPAYPAIHLAQTRSASGTPCLPI